MCSVGSRHMFFHFTLSARKGGKATAMLRKLRRSGRKVNDAAVERMWGNLHHLWTDAPLSFIELVRKSRTRKHRVFSDPSTLHNLTALGFCDPRSDYAVHDAYRELIQACVENKGLKMVLCGPWMDDGEPIDERVALKGEMTGTPHLVDGVMDLLLHLQEAHYTAFVELVRLVRDDKPASNLFAGTITTLVECGAAEVVDYTKEMIPKIVAAIAASDGPKPSILVVPRYRKIVVRDVVASILKITATGKKGLGFNLESPYPEEPK